MTKEETKQYFIELYVEHIKQEDIPEWANWIATDVSGEVWVFGEKPNKVSTGIYCGVWSDPMSPLFVCRLDNVCCWENSRIKLKEILPHYPSQQKGEPVKDKIEFEAVSGDQSLFDLVGAKDDDLFIVRKHDSPYTGIFAFKKNYSSSGEVLAERKVKEKPYIPEVGYAYKLSKEYSDIFTCVFVDNEGDVWSTCDGVMFTHYLDYLSRNNIKFIRVN